MKLSPLPAKIFVVVSFVFDVSKLGYLEQSAPRCLATQRSVDVCIVTNAPDKLERVFESWDVSRERLWVCAESWAANADDHKYC